MEGEDLLGSLRGQGRNFGLRPSLLFDRFNVLRLDALCCILLGGYGVCDSVPLLFALQLFALFLHSQCAIKRITPPNTNPVSH